MGKSKSSKRQARARLRAKYPWVTPEAWPEPSMHGAACAPYSLPKRSIEDDEQALRPADDNSAQLPCVNGASCCAIIDIAGGPGVPLRALAPTLKCILCHRRDMRAAYIETTVLEHPAPTHCLYQMWESPVGENGYAPSVCIGPDPDQRAYNGFVSSCAVGLASHYAWVHENGSWRVDQSALYQHFRKAPRSCEPPRGGASSVSYVAKLDTDTRTGAGSASSAARTSSTSPTSPRPSKPRGPAAPRKLSVSPRAAPPTASA